MTIKEYQKKTFNKLIISMLYISFLVNTIVMNVFLLDCSQHMCYSIGFNFILYVFALFKCKLEIINS